MVLQSTSVIVMSCLVLVLLAASSLLAGTGVGGIVTTARAGLSRHSRKEVRAAPVYRTRSTQLLAQQVEPQAALKMQTDEVTLPPVSLLKPVAQAELTRDRLAAVILLTELRIGSQDRAGALKTCLRLLRAHVLPHTPTDVHIFTTAENVGAAQQVVELALGAVDALLVRVTPLNMSSWVVPELARNESTWHGWWPESYRLMGEWRMTGQMDFARSLGYRYVLQVDDDAFVLEPLAYNIVRHFDEHNTKIAVRHVRQDAAYVTWGLAELARYFIMTERYEPTMLYDFCSPKSLDGVYTPLMMTPMAYKDLDILRRAGAKDWGGWNRTVLEGNFLALSVDFWFEPQVQRFVNLCRMSGGAFKYRWNEQGVQAMAWQLFVGRDEFTHFDFAYQHRGSANKIIRKLYPEP